MITSEAVGVKKPDPRIFQFALEKANATVAESVMIGDDLNTDISGAIGVNMKCIFYNPNKHNHNSLIWKEVSALSEIKNILL